MKNMKLSELLTRKMADYGYRGEAEMAKALGDVLWYCAELATGLGFMLGDVALRNIDKLKARYPEGFDPERSIHREA